MEYSILFTYNVVKQPVGKSSNPFVFGVEGLSLNLNSDTVLQTACHRCKISSKGTMLLAGAIIPRRVLKTRCTLWRKTASITKDLILIHTLLMLDYLPDIH